MSLWGRGGKQNSLQLKTTALDSPPFAFPQLSAFGEKKQRTKERGRERENAHKETSGRHLIKTVITTLPDSTVCPGGPIHEVTDTLESSFQCEWCLLGLATPGPSDGDLRPGFRQPSSLASIWSPGEWERDTPFPNSRKTSIRFPILWKIVGNHFQKYRRELQGSPG